MIAATRTTPLARLTLGAGIALCATAGILAGCAPDATPKAASASPEQISQMQAALHKPTVERVLYQSADFNRDMKTVPPSSSEFPSAKPHAAANPMEEAMQKMRTVRDPVQKALLMTGLGMAMQSFKPKAIVSTNKGTFEIAVMPNGVPENAGSFIDLAYRHFYDGLTFHRYVPGFVIQGGDPLGNGRGGPGYQVPDEDGPLLHDAGAVAMAKSGPNTAGSQFYITLNPEHQLDHHYAVIGKVVSGMDVVRKLRAGDKIIQMKMTGLPPGYRSMVGIALGSVKPAAAPTAAAKAAPSQKGAA